MHPPLLIEVDDERLAESLRRHLQWFEVDAVEVDGHWEVRVDLLERNPHGRVVDALSAIDDWLTVAGIPSVRVHVDGTSYTLQAPPRSLSDGIAGAPA